MRNHVLIIGLCLLFALANQSCLKSTLQKGQPETAAPARRPVKAPPPALQEATAAVAPRAALANYVVDCDRALIDLAGPLQQIADSLTALNLMYSARDLADCSGIYHRTVQALQARCPHIETPEAGRARSAEAIARWYAERRELILIQDALAQADLIKPGAVMFYGRDLRVYRKLKPEQALAAVHHLGIVVSVERDAEGNVISYQLFQGRAPGKPAATTNFHWRQPARPTFPPFGNGEQQWIGLARLVNASSY